MIHTQNYLKVETTGKALYPITRPVSEFVQASKIQTGLCTLFLRHTSASLIIQENADPDVLADLETFLTKLVPEGSQLYRHGTEGLDDMPGHIRTMLTRTSETIPIVQGRLALGTWQGIYLWEHRRATQKRELLVHVSGVQ
ncbi:MAG: YjbQ family protein [Anaerolineae bacterium]|nr:YjbQ family protein [Gloeobacterales cyanobacterium ES-bin-313]